MVNNSSVLGWDPNGRNNKTTDSDYDIIAEWPEPKLRPWNLEEVPLGAWMREKRIGSLPSLIVALTDNSLWRGHGDRIDLDYAAKHYEHSTDNGKTWLPCGVLE